MRILYLSCHSILEFDEILLLHELGHYVFSPGAYVEPRNPGDASLRPGLLDMKYDQADLDAWYAISGGDDNDRKMHLTRALVDRFDIIMVMHIPNWIKANWDVCLGKRVIWRTIGQCISGNEAELAPYRRQGLNIVRYSPREEKIPGYIGADAVIRFYKDPREFDGWTGEIPSVVTFNQAMPKRAMACNYDLYCEVMEGLPHKLYGPGNEDAGPCNQGKVSFLELKQAMRQHRAYFYVGTHPASYTLNFIEAALTGIPIVAIGPEYGNAYYFPGHDLYEIPDLITNGVNGFYSNSVQEMRDQCRRLLESRTLAQQISGAGREMAIKHFGKDKIKAEWGSYLSSL